MSNVGVHLTLTRFGISNEEQRKARARSSSSSREPRSTPDPVRQGKKRRRDNSASSFGDAVPPLADENFERDSELSFEDGNIILATEHVYFCVHKSILSMNSPVWRDILSMPQPDNVTSEEQYDGKPLVVLSDDDVDLEHFLKVMYYRK